MSLKTSFFNKTLVKSDFKRLWWVPVLHALALFLTGTFPYLQKYQMHRTSPLYFVKDTNLVSSTIYRIYTPAFVLGLTVPVILAALLFSYLQSGKSSTFAHSVPASRGAAFISHSFSGIIMISIPLLANCAVLLLMRTDPEFANTFYLSHLFSGYGIAILYSLVAFSLAVLVAMICGNAIANIIFTYVFGILPLAAELFCAYFADTQLYGFVLDTDYWCTRHLYLTVEDTMSAGGVILYIVLPIVFFVSAYFLYRIRNIENHSEVVAFPVLRPVFIFGVALCSGAVGYAYIQSLFNTNSIWAMLPFGIIGLIIASMIAKKSFRKLGLLKPVAVYCALVVCLFCVFGLDLTGFEKRVPDAGNVEYVTFEISGINSDHDGWRYDSEGRKYKFDYCFSPDIKDASEISAITTMHKFLTGTENINPPESWYATLTYNLKNGKKLVRCYDIDFKEYQHVLEPLITTGTMRRLFFPILRDESREYIDVAVKDIRIADENLVPLSDNKDVINEFITALKKDTQNASYSEYSHRGSNFTQVELHYRKSAHYEDGTAVSPYEINDCRETYQIRPGYVNTLAVIEKYKLKVSIPQASDIVAIGVDYYGAVPGERATLQKIGDSKFSDRMYPYVVESPEDIAQIYEYCCKNGGSRSVDMHLEFMLCSGHSFYCELNSQTADVPECIKVLINK